MAPVPSPAPPAATRRRRPTARSDEASSTTTAAGVDGRLARGERTRRALADALLALLEEGEPRPTARQVADRAGVSLRLVFHHFEDMEAVLRSAVAIQVERHWSRLQPVDPALPRVERVGRVARQRAALYEAIAPVRRAAALVEQSSPTVAAELAHARRLLRAELAEVFELELATAGPRRAQVLDMLDVAGAWESWDQLRGHMGRGPAACRRLMAEMMQAVLDTTPGPGGTP